jgi:hypothetical protein
MKVFILNRNYLSWPNKMAIKLTTDGHEVIFIDCGSNYAPLLDYYDSCEFKVIRISNKLGNRSPWDAGIVTTLNEPYVVTDPDFDLTTVPNDWAEVLLEGFQQFPDKNKFGLSLEEKEVPPENPAWIEDRFNQYPDGLPMTWGCGLPNNWYNYPCDTTFALQRPHTPGEIGGVRKGRPYTATHLPWHITLDPTSKPGARAVLCDDEIAYYFLTCENSSMTWGRMERYGMITEYLRRKGETKESLIQRYYRKGIDA